MRESDPELCLKASSVSLKGACSGLCSVRHIWVNRNMSLGSACPRTHCVTLNSDGEQVREQSGATLMSGSIRISRGLFPACLRSPMPVFLCLLVELPSMETATSTCGPRRHQCRRRSTCTSEPPARRGCCFWLWGAETSCCWSSPPATCR